MALLAEYALTPDVFDTTSYTGTEISGVYLQQLKEVLLHEGIVRDLRAGEWAALFATDTRPWHRRAKELLKKLRTQSRLVPFPAVGAARPVSDVDWCREALETHRQVELAGVIVTEQVKDQYVSEPLVARVDKLPSTSWWTARSPSLRLKRTLADYQSALILVLRHASHLMFIDPHLDPGVSRYRDFAALLQTAAGRKPAPLIEIHRVAWFGSSQDKRPRCDELEESFRAELTGPLNAAGLAVEVFLWDDFHDRHLITNLIGIHMSNGFDTTRAAGAVTTWSRLGRDDRDDVQREFDPATNRHGLRHRFRLP